MKLDHLPYIAAFFGDACWRGTGFVVGQVAVLAGLVVVGRSPRGARRTALRFYRRQMTTEQNRKTTTLFRLRLPLPTPHPYSADSQATPPPDQAGRNFIYIYIHTSPRNIQAKYLHKEAHVLHAVIGAIAVVAKCFFASVNL